MGCSGERREKIKRHEESARLQSKTHLLRRGIAIKKVSNLDGEHHEHEKDVCVMAACGRAGCRHCDSGVRAEYDDNPVRQQRSSHGRPDRSQTDCAGRRLFAARTRCISLRTAWSKVATVGAYE